MRRWAILGVVYGTSLLLLLIGTSLLFLEQIINTETLSTTTIQMSRVVGSVVLLVLAVVWFLRQSFQTVVTWFLEDMAQAWLQLRQRTLQTIQQEPYHHWAALVGILILAIMMRLPFFTQPIRTDEALTYLQFASKPLYIALSDYAAPNNHLLHTFLVYLSTRFLGNGETAIRLPAFVCGILVILAAYLAVRALYHKHAALVAAGLCAVSSVLIEYSVNARGYTLQMTLFLLAFALAVYVRKNTRPAVWALLVILLALGFYTVPTMLYGAVIIMVWLLISVMLENMGADRQKLLVYWLVSGIATGILTLLLYLPVFIVSGISAVTSNRYVQALAFSQFIEQTPQAWAALWQHWHTSVQPMIGVVLASGAGFAFVWQCRVGRQPLSWAWVALSILPPILWVQRVHPFERVWLFLLPLYLGMAAAGVCYLAVQVFKRMETTIPIRMMVGYGLAGSIVSIGALTVLQTQSPYHSIETGTFRDAEAVAVFFANHPSAEKIIYEHPSGESLRYYFVRHHLPLTRLEWDYTPHESLYIVVNTEYAQNVESVMRQNGLRAADYDVALAQQFPLAALFMARLRGVED